MKTIGDVLLEMADIKKQLDRCPHIIRRRAGDESYDICELNTKPCLVEHNLYECETWNEIQKEG